MLHLVQSVEGRITPEGIEACAEILDISAAEVSGVATFYTMYKRKPVGDYLVGVCTNTLCAVMGGDAIFERLKDHLDVGNDETTPDGKVTLEHIECNAACDYAPVMMVNWEFMDNMTPSSAVQLVDDLREGKEVTSTRGPRICTWREAERVLAGFPDGRVDEGPGAGHASLVGLELARENAAGPRPTADDARRGQQEHRQRHRRVQGGCRGPGRHLPRRDRDQAGRGQEEWQDDMGTLTPVLTDIWDAEQSWKLATYEDHGGYGALKTALGMAPAAIIEAVKDSGLRGRGGAGFPTGMKWSFIPQDNPKPKYLVVNADESEPGTCKDIPLMMANPHVLVEGVIISSFAIRAHTAFIYIRGEVLHVIRRVQAAVDEAYAAGHLGTDIHGSGYDLDIVVHTGAGAYICGEETALLEGLEGRRGQPRLRPPFPAVAGLYASPTVINNVESIASVPEHHRARRRVVRLDGHREVQGLRHLQPLRPRHPARPVRSAARHHAARADRPGRRHARGPHAEVLDAGRLQHAAADRRAPRRTPRLRGGRRGRLDARHPRAAALRRDHLRGPGGAALDRVLQARVVRQVHPVPRGHLVAGADPGRAREGRGPGERPRPAARPVRQHLRPLVLRARRRCRRARSRARSSTSATSTSSTSPRAAARSTR